MNINIIFLFLLLLMSFACAVHVLIVASFFQLTHFKFYTPLCFSPFRFYPCSVLDSFEVMASAHVSLPPSPEPPGVSQWARSHWCSGLTTFLVTNDQERGAW